MRVAVHVKAQDVVLPSAGPVKVLLPEPILPLRLYVNVRVS